ncbi:hypothetical protein Pelo_11604 [Pelomyxa schiedti]|nr:hypothetical protein Pelo_11604 [Pelomyxa schiedti]
MTDATNWEENFYNEVYTETIENLDVRRRTDELFTKPALRHLLDSLYARQGNNYEGRGSVQDIKQSAQIAAHECFLANWDKDAS